MKFGQARIRRAACAVCLLLFSLCCEALGAENSAWTVQSSRREDAGNVHMSRTLAEMKNVATGEIVRLRVLRFAPEFFKVAVVDNSDGRENLAEAMQRIGALAGVNGGYFHPDRTPVGLEISGGKMVHAFERAKLLSGVLVVTSGRIKLLRATEFSGHEKPGEALQAGPFLIDRGKIVAGLNEVRRARRTAVAECAGPLSQALVVCEPVTLAEFAQILAQPVSTGAGAVQRALNLDGGSSTGMWLAGGGTADIGNPNANVRNYVAIYPRKN